MSQGHEQCCFVLKHARVLAKKKIKFLKTVFMDNTWILRKICEFLNEDLFFGDHLFVAKNLRPFWAKTFFLFEEYFCVVFSGLGLEHSCPWLQEGLSSEGLSLASDFFVFLALASSLVSSTPPLVFALLISTPRYESINFYQNMLEIKLFLQKNKIFRALGAPLPEPQWLLVELPEAQNSPSPHCWFLVAHLILDVCCSCFQVLEYYNEKLLSYSNNNRYLQ